MGTGNRQGGSGRRSPGGEACRVGRDGSRVESREKKSRMGEAQERETRLLQKMLIAGAWDVCGESRKLFGGRDWPGETMQNPQAHGEGLELTPADRGSQPVGSSPL